MSYCIRNIRFGFINCIVFGVYSVVLYVVLYLEYKVSCNMLYHFWNIQFGFIYCIVLYCIWSIQFAFI